MPKTDWVDNKWHNGSVRRIGRLGFIEVQWTSVRLGEKSETGYMVKIGEARLTKLHGDMSTAKAQAERAARVLLQEALDAL